MDSPLTAAVIDAAAELLDETTATGRTVLAWEGDPSGTGNALALRLAGGLHALARKGECPLLTALYASKDAEQAHAAVGEALAKHDAFLWPWLDGPPQTNETGRSAAIYAGLMTASARFGLPFELLELGSSAGLNLNLSRFGYDLGGMRAGDPESPVRIAPDWHGAPPPDAPVEILSARGVDIAPLDPTDPAIAERLIAYAWADQPARLARLEGALKIAVAHPPRIDRGDAGEWLEQRLAEPQREGVVRAVFHTIMLQYVSPETRARIDAALAKAGAEATETRPLVRISMEAEGEKGIPALRLRTWPGGEDRLLAHVHPHGASLRWL